MAKDAVKGKALRLRQACEAFGISQTYYRYEPKLSAADCQPAQLGLRALLPVPAQCEGVRLELATTGIAGGMMMPPRRALARQGNFTWLVLRPAPVTVIASGAVQGL